MVDVKPAAVPAFMPMSAVKRSVLQFLRDGRVRRATDIYLSCCKPDGRDARQVLRALQHRGLLERVALGAEGESATWRITPAGVLALEDDARLIGAAPDLLSIAKRILDRGYVSPSMDEERGDHQALVAAIAKAEGLT